MSPVFRLHSQKSGGVYVLSDAVGSASVRAQLLADSGWKRTAAGSALENLEVHRLDLDWDAQPCSSPSPRRA
jgi:hypothetical protein